MTRIESIWNSWVRSFLGQTSLLCWSTLERIHWLHGCLTWEDPNCLSLIRVTRVTSCSVPQNLKLEVPTPLQIQSLRLRCYGQKLAIDLSDLSLSILGKLAKCSAYKMAWESLAHQETMLRLCCQVAGRCQPQQTLTRLCWHLTPLIKYGSTKNVYWRTIGYAVKRQFQISKCSFCHARDLLFLRIDLIAEIQDFRAWLWMTCSLWVWYTTQGRVPHRISCDFQAA